MVKYLNNMIKALNKKVPVFTDTFLIVIIKKIVLVPLYVRRPLPNPSYGTDIPDHHNTLPGPGRA